jgi:integrase/recombinase XerC
MFETNSFQTYLEGRGSARLTVEGYLRDVRLFSQWFEQSNREQLSPQKMTQIDVRLYRQWLMDQRAAPTTINRRLAALRCFGECLKSSGELDHNPAEGIRMVEIQQTAPKWLSKQDQTALLRQLDRSMNAATSEAGRRQAIRDRAAAVMLLNTGLRVAELCDLKLADIELSERKGSVFVRNGKGSKSRRIPLNQAARKATKLWMQYRPEGGELFLSGKGGDGLSTNAFERRLKLIGRQCGIEVTPHELRHSFAKNLLDAGVSIDQVAKLLGHSRIETTKLYVIPSEADLAKAVEKLDF